MDLWNEIREEQQKGNLSNEQLLVLTDFMNSCTYEQIRTKYNISCNNVIVRIIIRTIQLYYWCPNFPGGTDYYLCERDLGSFYKFIIEQSNDINCVTCSTALQLATNLKRERIKKATHFLQQIKKVNLIHHLGEAKPPCRDIIYSLAEQLNLKIVTSQTLEYGRRVFCDYNSIIQYFIFYGILFQRDSRLILNMDETSLSSRKRLKVLAKKNQLPLIIESPKIPHLTGVITVSASGDYFKPLIVLPNKKTLRSLKHLEDRCYLVSTLSGWMTKKTFIYYTFLLISQISHYRLQLDPSIRNNSIILILDGAKSHISFISAYLFYLFNIDLLLLPPHTSHLLSPFDVSLASPLKLYFSQFLNEFNLFTNLSLRKNLTFLRNQVIESFISSAAKACTPANIKSGFSQTGISPLNPEIPLSTDYAIENNNIFQNFANSLPTFFLNSEAGLAYLFYQENNRNVTQNDFKECYQKAIDILTKDLKINSGIPLSKIPEILIDNGQTIEKLQVPILSK